MSLTVIILVIAVIVGIASTQFLGDNNAVEEEAETIVENEAEKLLGLSNDELKGKINLNIDGKAKNDPK